jgi:hypothetical protein
MIDEKIMLQMNTEPVHINKKTTILKLYLDATDIFSIFASEMQVLLCIKIVELRLYSFCVY